MKIGKLVMLVALVMILGILGASQALAYMQESYYGVCVELNGIPGLLQRAHFFQLGNCRIKRGSTTQCQDNGACTITSPSGNISGHCSDASGQCKCVHD